MTERDFNAIGGVLAILCGLVIAAFIAFKFMSSMTEDYQGSQLQKTRTAQYMKDQNCKVSGYYGRHGERKVYTCDDGKVWKESQL